MGDHKVDQPETAVREIADLDVEQLFAELEIRRRMLADDPSLAASFDVTAQERSSIDDRLSVLSRMGRSFYARFNRDLYELVCRDTKDAKEIRSRLMALMTNEVSVTAYLATCAVAYLGVAPLLATVIAALVTKLVLNNVKDTICDEWKTSLSLD